MQVTFSVAAPVLKPADGCCFDSRRRHCFRTGFDGPSEIVGAITPPTS